jgi:hypothetical protein
LGRVEETTILFRLRHIRFQGSLQVSHDPYAVQDDGLPARQTGLAVFPHPAFVATLASGTRRQLHGDRSQRIQPEPFEVLVVAEMLRLAITPLAASL